MRTLARLAPLLLVSASLGGACGGGQTRGTPFDPGWRDDGGAAMATLARTFGDPTRAPPRGGAPSGEDRRAEGSAARKRGRGRLPDGADVAVGVVGNNALVGVLLDGGATWTFAHEISGRPAVAGGVVVGAGDEELFALDARSGKLFWTRPASGRIRGAGDDGLTTVISLVPVTGTGSVVLAVARDGAVVRQFEDPGVIGVPAVAGDLAFLPWQGRFLSVVELPTGDERARLHVPGGVSRAFALGGTLFFGDRGATRFDAQIGRGVTAAPFPVPVSGLPGRPSWTRPETSPPGRAADALDRVRLYARPTTEGPAGIEGGRFAATYARAALGLDAVSGAIVWAHAHVADFIGGAAYAGGFALCDAAGEVTFLDARSGVAAGHVSLGKAVDACEVQADALRKPASTGVAPPLAEQLAAVMADPATDPALKKRLSALSADIHGHRAAPAPDESNR
jgi:outer membrane protein assembly factor BamB